MIGRLALRSLTAHPVRSGVLAIGFGAGVAVMAILLGVAEVVLRQAQSPALVGGGDVLVRLAPQVPAQLVLSGTLQSDALRTRIAAASPFHTADLYLITGGRSIRVDARGGIPSRERRLSDAEITKAVTWTNSPADASWTQETPERVLRQIDRFHAIPVAPKWQDSWGEWLYFNGHQGDVRFYLTFLVGPPVSPGRRAAGIRLNLDGGNGNGQQIFTSSAVIAQSDVDRAPDLTIGDSWVKLVGLQYRIHLDLTDANGSRVRGDLTLDASPGQLVPPIETSGSQGWVTGYVVPVMSGRLGGGVQVGTRQVSLAGGSGYHDHNWGFWQNVSWQWGQAQHEGVSIVYGRVFPPPEAADPERLPGFAGVLGPDGPLGYATSVKVTETDGPGGQPRRIEIRAKGAALDARLQFDAAAVTVTPMGARGMGAGMDFIQLRGTYTVSGRAGSRQLSFTAPGAAETFRGH